MVCGSMTFAKEMLEAQKVLTSLGHTVNVPCGTQDHIEGITANEDLEANAKYCIETDVMRRCFALVADAEGVLVLNYPKNGIDGYIGVSALMELGLAHYLRKKIFLLYPIPSFAQARWSHEVSIFQPTIIRGDFTKVC